MVAVYDHTHSALAVAALLFAGQALPAFVVPAVVARVEASRRRSELSGLYFFEAVATAALAVLLWHFSLPAVLLLAALDGTAALAASALLRAELARAAREQARGHPLSAQEPRRGLGERGSARPSARRTPRSTSPSRSRSCSDPALGGVVVAAAGAPAALFIDVGSFLLCGALLLDLHPHVEEAGGDSVRSRLRAAWKHINEAPALRGLLLAEAVALSSSKSAGRSR